jgi:hypothetical protein
MLATFRLLAASDSHENGDPTDEMLMAVLGEQSFEPIGEETDPRNAVRLARAALERVASPT